MKTVSSIGLCQTLHYPYLVHASLLIWALVCAFVACTCVFEGNQMFVIDHVCIISLQC